MTPEEKNEIERRMERDGDPRWHRWMGMMTAISALLQFRGNGPVAVEGRKIRERLIIASRDFALFGEAGPWKKAMDDYGPLSVQSMKKRGVRTNPKLPVNDEEFLAEVKRLGVPRAARQWSATPAAVRARMKKISNR